MHSLPFLTTLATLSLTILAAPAPSPASPSHRLVARDGPCDAFSEACRPVINANACFAAYVMFGEREQMLQCVDHEDAARAEELLCQCYGCSETTVQDWARGNLACAAEA